MKNTRIEDLSAIKQNNLCEESRATFEESNPKHINCPEYNRQNYQCPICNRLRAVCPYTNLKQCQHVDRKRIGSQYQSKYMDLSSMSTMPGERIRIQSINQGAKYDQNRNFNSLHINQELKRNQRAQIPQSSPIPTSSEVIFYPVIHNRFVMSTNLQKSHYTTTPTRVKKITKEVGEGILTPTQLKEMMDSYRQQ